MLKKIKKWFGFPTVADYQKIILERLEEIEMSEVDEKTQIQKKKSLEKSLVVDEQTKIAKKRSLEKKSPAKKKAPVKKSPAKKTSSKKSTKKK